ncbi:hypothetical protein Q7P37_001366 [Cladosporium fusiforme]
MKPKGVGRWWPWEWLCEMLAVASLGAMILVLIQYNDKPQSEWQMPYFTLNGLIAFLATLTKTGLIIPVSAAIGQRKWLRFLPNRKGSRQARRLGDFETFDEASRGAFGSAKLIFSLNAWDVACLGALITIVSVFFSAVTQNVLGTYASVRDGRLVDLHAGRVPRSEFFNKTNQLKWTSLSLKQNFRTDVSTIAAIYSGIMSDKVPDVPISCATGDCTWPIVPTFGICGACMDMQRHLQVGACTGSQGSEGYCNFSIPGGTTLSKPRTMMEWNETTPVFTAGPGSDYIFNQTNIVGQGHIYRGISFNFIGQSYSEFMYANRGNYSPANETAYHAANVLAYECGLWPCLQARSVKASDGVVEDILVGHRNGASPEEVPNMIRDFEDDSSFNINNITDYRFDDVQVLESIRHTLLGAFSGSITINGNQDIDYVWADIPQEELGVLPGGGFGSSADCVHAAWTYASDIDRWWARLAKSMTNDIRMNGLLRNEDEERYAGTAWTDITYIEVRWLWLTFPGALVVLSTIFLVATMVASCRSGVNPWKSFILPVLYTRLEDGLQEEWMQEYARQDTLLSEVKDRWVGLDDCEDSWIFRHVSKKTKKVRQIRLAGDTSVDG